MKLMRVASMALAAYLVSSAEAHVHDHDLGVIALERRVELRASAPIALGVVAADDDPVGAHEVVDARRLP